MRAPLRGCLSLYWGELGVSRLRTAFLLGFAYLLANSHETRHLILRGRMSKIQQPHTLRQSYLGDLDLFATECGEGDV